MWFRRSGISNGCRCGGFGGAETLSLLAIAFLFVALAFTGCGVPNLDPPECAGSRGVIREFYSFHFGNEMRFSPDGLKASEKYLTPALIENVRNAAEGTDPFTTGDSDLPKAFRTGECRVLSPERTEFDVLLFWKDDTRSEQRTIKVQAVNSGGRWLVDKIER